MKNKTITAILCAALAHLSSAAVSYALTLVPIETTRDTLFPAVTLNATTIVQFPAGVSQVSFRINGLARGKYVLQLTKGQRGRPGFYERVQPEFLEPRSMFGDVIRNRTLDYTGAALSAGLYNFKMYRCPAATRKQSNILSVCRTVVTQRTLDLRFGAPRPMAPVANAGIDQSLADSDWDRSEPVTLNASASHDPDGAIATYEWREGTSLLSRSSNARVTLPLQVATHDISLTVTDQHGLSATDSVRVVVRPNDAEMPSSWAAVGINVSDVDRYSSELPFVNLMHQAGKWSIRNANVDPANLVDANGWPTSLPAGAYLTTNLVGDMPYYRAGRYVATFLGDGDLRISGSGISNFTRTSANRYEFDVTPNISGITVDVTRVNGSVRNIKVMPLANEQTEPEFPFNDNFVATLRGANTIRFMKWFRSADPEIITKKDPITGQATTFYLHSGSGDSVTLAAAADSRNDYYKDMLIRVDNGNGKVPRLITGYNGTTKVARLNRPLPAGSYAGRNYEIHRYHNLTWSKHPTPNQFRERHAGVPVELMVKLCNQVQAGPWLSIPSAASDDYVRGLAQYLKDHLNPDLKIYIEWGNELWNWGGGGEAPYYYAQAKSGEVFQNDQEDVEGYQAYRSLQIFRIFDDVFSEQHLRENRTTSRLHRLFGVKTVDISPGGATTGYYGNPSRLATFDGARLKPGYLNPVESGRKAHHYIDSLSASMYWGAKYFDGLVAGIKTIDDVINGAMEDIDSQTHVVPGDSGSGKLLHIRNLGRSLGVQTTIYEGSFSLIPDPYGYEVTGHVYNGVASECQRPTKDTICLNYFQSMQADAGAIGKVIRMQTGPNAFEERTVVAYANSTLSTSSTPYRVATLDSAWTVQPPVGAVYKIMTKRNALADSVNRHPRMRELYEYALESWAALGEGQGPGAALFCHFVGISELNNYGRFGLVERPDFDPRTQPRWLGFDDFRRSHPAWW